ncbi:MAG: hypothetical protein ABI867_23280, partial [Kofleriaceae bacterium]
RWMRFVVLAVLAIGCSDAPTCEVASPALADVCLRDHWSADMRRCMASAPDDTVIAECFSTELGPRRTRPGALPEVVQPRSLELAVAKMESYTTQMCRCQDRHCADAVQAGFMRWVEQLVKHADPDEPPPADQRPVQRMTESAERYGKCMMTAMTAN